MTKFSVFFYLFLYMSFVFAEDELTCIGYAHDKQTGDLIYTENHFERYKENILLSARVIYKDNMENDFAEKSIDFSSNPFMPEFSLKNRVTGHREATRYVEGKYEVIFTKKNNDQEKNALLSYPETGISDAGFDNFIITHWQDIVAGKVFKREFLIPSMTDFINFRIYQNEEVNEDGLLLRVINIEPDSFLIRAFSGTTKLYYTDGAPKLVRFDGISNMRDKKGDNYKVTIHYQDC